MSSGALLLAELPRPVTGLEAVENLRVSMVEIPGLGALWVNTYASPLLHLALTHAVAVCLYFSDRHRQARSDGFAHPLSTMPLARQSWAHLGTSSRFQASWAWTTGEMAPRRTRMAPMTFILVVILVVVVVEDVEWCVGGFFLRVDDDGEIDRLGWAVYIDRFVGHVNSSS